MRLHQVVAVVVACGSLANRPAEAASVAETPKWRTGVDSIDITVAAREVGDADLARGIYIFHLKCSRSCELSRITLNKCLKAESGELSFTPTVDNWIGPQWISAKQIANRIRVRVYQAFGRHLPADIDWIFNSDRGRLTSLSTLKTAGFIDYSQFPAKIVSIGFEPIPHARSKILDCAVALKGLAQ